MDDDAEATAAIERLMRKHDRKQSDQTTDDDGHPLPRIDLDGSPSDVDDPLLAVGYALLSHLTDDWQYAMLQASAAADHVRMLTLIKGPSRPAFLGEPLLYLPDVADACIRLRRSMYEPDGRGAWYSMVLRLNANGAIVARYDYDGPPFMQWGPGDAALLVRDQERYPRPPERLPAWHPAR